MMRKCWENAGKLGIIYDYMRLNGEIMGYTHPKYLKSHPPFI
jgi:hypothetical protein